MRELEDEDFKLRHARTQVEFPRDGYGRTSSRPYWSLPPNINMYSHDDYERSRRLPESDIIVEIGPNMKAGIDVISRMGNRGQTLMHLQEGLAEPRPDADTRTPSPDAENMLADYELRERRLREMKLRLNAEKAKRDDERMERQTRDAEISRYLSEDRLEDRLEA